MHLHLLVTIRAFQATTDCISYIPVLIRSLLFSHLLQGCLSVASSLELEQRLLEAEQSAERLQLELGEAEQERSRAQDREKDMQNKLAESEQVSSRP